MSDLSLAFLRALRETSSAGTPAGTPGPLLYGLVRQLRPDTIVETGTWQGHSTLWLAQGCKDNGLGRVYSLDDWSLSPGLRGAVQENLVAAGLDGQVVLVEGDSLDERLWPPAVDLAFLDGCHDLRHPEREFAMAHQRGAKVIVLHDTTSWWGPRQLAENLQRRGAKILDLPFGDGVALWCQAERGPERFSEADHPTGALVVQ